MNIKIVDNQGNEVVQEPPKPIENPQTSAGLPEGYMDQLAASQVLGLENDSDRAQYKDELQKIIEWAKLEGYETPESLKWTIRKLQDRLGTPPLTEKWITRVARYATLALQEQRIRQEQDSLMKGFDSDPGQ